MNPKQLLELRFAFIPPRSFSFVDKYCCYGEEEVKNLFISFFYFRYIQESVRKRKREDLFPFILRNFREIKRENRVNNI